MAARKRAPSRGGSKRDSRPKPGEPGAHKANGDFAKGNSGGPGRPPGIPSLRKALLRELEKNPDGFATMVHRHYQEGCAVTRKFILERAWPQEKQLEVTGAQGGELKLSWKQDQKEDT